MAAPRKNLWPTPIPRKPVRGPAQDFKDWKAEQRRELSEFKKKCGA